MMSEVAQSSGADPLLGLQPMTPKELATSAEALEALVLLRSSLPLFAPLATCSDLTKEQKQTLSALLVSASRTSESTMLLCQYSQFWDAEMLVRAIVEATLKFCYILQSPETLDARYQEYAEDLWQIDRLKDHKKNSDLLNVLPDSEDSRLPIRARLISPEELAQLSKQYPGAVRRELDRKWGFTGLIGELETSGDPFFTAISALSSGYSNSSHMQHASFAGVMTAMERSNREPARQDAVEELHRNRIFSDVFVSQQLRLQTLYRHAKVDSAPLRDRFLAQEAFLQRSAETHARWITMEYGRQSET